MPAWHTSRVLIVQAALAVLCFGALLLLPGLGIQVIVRSVRAHALDASDVSDDHDPKTVMAHSVGLSLVSLSVLGYLLLSIDEFTGSRLAMLMAPLAFAGLLALPALVRRVARAGWTIAILLVLAAPFAEPAVRPGAAPISGFNWYYWGLGRALSASRGVPTWVSEYGVRVRWQPDYLSFNVLTEAFRGMFPGGSDVDVLSAWKVPVAVLTVVVTYATLSLWFRRPSALIGTALAVVTTLYTAKLGNARPEMLGFALGLVAVVIGTDALRRVRPSGYLLAAAVLAIDFSVHAIGALVAAVLLATGTLCEVLGTYDRRSVRVRMTLGGFAVFVAIVGATGWALQGRVFVGGNAGNPRMISGEDPTLTYFKLTEGLSARPDVWDRLRGQLLDILQTVTPSGSSVWLVGAVALVLVVVTLVAGPGRARNGAVAALGLAVFFAATAAWFGLRYHTFVPQNTGLSRFVQWAPLVYVLALTCGIEVVTDRVVRTRSRRGNPRSPPAAWPAQVVAGLLCVGAASAWAVVTTHEFPARLPLTSESAAAIDQVRARTHPGDSLLTNVVTHGLLEYSTQAEVPIEGRQPVIEDARVLERTNNYLRRVTAFFTSPRSGDATRLFRARWVLVTDDPTAFGATRTFGPPLRKLPPTRGLSLVWSSAHASLYRNDVAVTDGPSVGPSRVALLRFLVGLIACLALVSLLLLDRHTTRRAAMASWHRRDRRSGSVC